MLIYRWLVRPMAGRPAFSTVLLTVALGIVLEGLVVLIWTPRVQYPAGPVGHRRSAYCRAMGGVISSLGALSVLTCLVVLAGLGAFFRYSRIGVHMLAAAENPLLVAQRGIDFHRLIGLAWGLAVASAAIAGILYSVTNRLEGSMAIVGFKAFPAALVGGMGSLGGVLPGALLVAVAEVAAIQFVSPQLGNAAPFLVLLLALLVRPVGPGRHARAGRARLSHARLALPALVLAVFAFPFLASGLAVHLANTVALAAIGALGLTLLTGNAGLLSLGLGRAARRGRLHRRGADPGSRGADLGHVAQRLSWSEQLLGAIVGLPSLRLRGLYLALSTLALHFVVTYLGSEYQSQRRLSSGIVDPGPTLGPLQLNDPRAWLLRAGRCAGAGDAGQSESAAHAQRRAWLALRDHELAARSVGVDVAAYKLAAFVVSSATISLAGALGAYYQHFVAVEGYTFFLTIQSIAMVLIGGVSSIAGALAGAAFVVLLPQVASVSHWARCPCRRSSSCTCSPFSTCCSAR